MQDLLNQFSYLLGRIYLKLQMISEGVGFAGRASDAARVRTMRAAGQRGAFDDSSAG